MPKSRGYRKPMSRRQSKKNFARRSGVHKKNRITTSMRGGYRL